MKRLDDAFFHRHALEVAPDLVGKLLTHTLPDGSELTLRISETEAYCGEADTACHAHRGRTPRTEILYRKPGTIYIYLCYGMHNLMNVITGEEGEPQGVLIRACVDAPGPGRLTKALQLDRSLNGEDIVTDPRLALYDDGNRYQIHTAPRVGIGYASEEDQARPWRFIMGEKE